ncbi:MAG: DUF3105 domain-containing protein [Candidatus Limnocylindrales bacterium]
MRTSLAAVPVHGQARARRDADNRRARQWRTIRLWGAVLGVALAVVLFVVWQTGAYLPQLGRDLPNEGGVGVHLQQGAVLTQRVVPPASGPHYASRAPYGVSTAAVAPGNWLHALEHGGVVVLYRCGGIDECTALGTRFEGEVFTPARLGSFGERKLVITPYVGLATPFAALSWARVLELETLDPAAILAFYDRYLDRGPERAA